VASHFLILSIFALLVSIAFSLLMRETRKEQIRFAIFSFVCFVGSAFVIGWLMYPFPS
jgi:cytochrome bd-type quinol oxidase subunit 2